MSLAELESVFELAMRDSIKTKDYVVDDACFENAFESDNSGEVKKWDVSNLERTARHEAGHALQDAKSYGPLKLRMSIIPACNIGSKLAIPLFLVGILLASAAADPMVGNLFMLLGIAAFSLSTLFQLITLPVEFNASRRAMEGMASCGILAGDELSGARKVLSAAAMTYVAALATSLLSLLRLIIIASNSRRR